MVRLRRLEITGFRGAMASLSVDLSADCRSIAIFGENAAGKSSITDAVEWFYTDRVDHLWRENCKESALRNALIDDKLFSVVTLEFSNGTLNCKKSLSSHLASSRSNQSAEFTNYLSGFQERHERLTLRNIDLLSFVMRRKAEKRQELESIIGYEALDAFRDAIGSTLFKLERTSEYIASRSSAHDHHVEMMRIARTSIHNEKGLFEAAERLMTEAGAPLKIIDAESYTVAIRELQARIHSKEKATRKVTLSDCKQRCIDLSKKVQETRISFELFSKSYAQLIESEEQLRQVKLVGLLTLGKQAIEGQLVASDTCPLCLQPKTWDSLKEELENRIVKLEESKQKYNAAFSKRNETIAKLNETVRTGHELISDAMKAGIDGAFLQCTEEYNVAAKNLERRITENFATYQPISTGLETTTESCVSILQAESERLALEEAALALPKEEQKLLDTFQAVSNLRSYFLKFRAALEMVKNFEAQIQALARIKSDFSVVHTAALQRALNLMSKDISRYYLAMHPNEDVDDIRLIVLEDGVEFDYSFHGKRVYPPLKYMSESHLNSLGIAAFLASARLLNKTNGFVVLDDIVTSFDANHRMRLLRLLRSEFSKWQIVLLTHEPFWFEMVKRETAPDGWLVAELEVTPGSGIRLKPSLKNLKEKIISKRHDGTLTANELRTATERILKDIGFRLEVRMAFRFNDQNERRMPGELLSELRSTLKKKSPGIASNPIFPKLETCGLVTTTGSHDSGPVLSSGDIATCCEDILTLDDQFYCKECSSYVSVEGFVRHEGKVYCRCGNKYIDWRE